MKVGDYVRTNDGVIGKVTKEQPFMNDILVFLDNKQGNVTYQSKDGVFKVNSKEDIVKSAEGTPRGLMNLIEVGDYVNGERVINIIKKHKYLEVSDEEIVIDEKDIKSIVTKEAFESIEYRIGE